MRVAVAGLGLIGGSIARGLAAAGHHVTGLDDPAILRRARRAGAIAASTTSLLMIVKAPPCYRSETAAQSEITLQLKRDQCTAEIAAAL